MEFTNTEKLYEIFLLHPQVCTDTRNVQKGSIFFALKGSNFNGNIFAKEALLKGAAYVVVDEIQETKSENFIFVEDALTALQNLAQYHRKKLGKKKLKVLALTGSNGKTTTKELIARVLSKKFKTHFTSGNLNNHIGVPLTLLQLNESHEIAVIEMGANHQKEIEFLCAITEPDFGLITNVGMAHLEGFGGPQGVLLGKTELFSNLLKNGGFAFLMSDDTRLVERAGDIAKQTYGTNNDATIKGNLIEANPFVVFEWQGNKIAKHTVKTQMIGDYNVTNLIAACAVGNYFEIDEKEIDDAIASYVPDNNRSQLIKSGTNTLVLDAYNANPSSMIAAIDNLARMKNEKKIIILGDMFELGEESTYQHQQIINLIAEKIPAATLLLVGELFSKTKYKYNSIKFSDSKSAASWIGINFPSNSLILIKGSRGVKMERCADVLMGI
jgi:UDP-N-acetylmuramoyl-tripeptide--D-alanyl-D-alanine ligase